MNKESEALLIMLIEVKTHEVSVYWDMAGDLNGDLKRIFEKIAMGTQWDLRKLKELQSLLKEGKK